MQQAATDIVSEFWRLMATNDFHAVSAVLSPDFVLEWPQSRERIRGPGNFAKMNAEYPAHAKWLFRIERLVGDQSQAVSDVSVTDGRQVGRAISFFTVAEGKITKLVEFWPEPFEAPPARAHLVERMAAEPGEPAADREFVHSRLIDAPRDRVFKAIMDPARLTKWWGPDGFTSTFEVFEPRPGGAWRFVLHGPDGTDYPNHNVFAEIVEAERVVIEHLSETHHFVLTITLEAQGGRTLVGWRQLFDTAAEKQRVADFVTPANEQNLDRLAAVVAGVAARRG